MSTERKATEPVITPDTKFTLCPYLGPDTAPLTADTGDRHGWWTPDDDDEADLDPRDE